MTIALTDQEVSAIGAVIDAYYESARAEHEAGADAGAYVALETLARYLDRVRAPAATRAPAALNPDTYDDNARIQDALSTWADRHLQAGDSDWTTVESMIELLQETLPARPETSNDA